MKEPVSGDAKALLILAKQRQLLKRTQRIARNINANTRRLTADRSKGRPS